MPSDRSPTPGSQAHQIPRRSQGGDTDLQDPVSGTSQPRAKRLLTLENLPDNISVSPLDQQALTTRRAANILGVSTPFLVKLLKQGEIRFHKVGSHHRIYFADLMAYKQRRDAACAQQVDNEHAAERQHAADRELEGAQPDEQQSARAYEAAFARWPTAMEEWDSPHDHENYDDL